MTIIQKIILEGQWLVLNDSRLSGWRISQQPTLKAGSGLKKELMWLKQAMSAGFWIFHQLSMITLYDQEKLLFPPNHHDLLLLTIISQVCSCRLPVGGHCGLAGSLTTVGNMFPFQIHLFARQSSGLGFTLEQWKTNWHNSLMSAGFP